MKKVGKLLLCCMLLLFTISNAENVVISSAEVIDSNENRVIGSFEVKNKEEIYYPDLYYTVTLGKSKPMEENPMYIVTEDIHEYGANDLVLKAGGSEKIYFEYEYPDWLERAQYKLKIDIYSKTLKIGTSKFINLGVLGSEEGFLEHQDAHWDVNGKEYVTSSGPNFPANKAIKSGIIELKSTFEDTVKVIPQITVYKRMKTFDDTPVAVETGKEITIKSNEKKKVTLEFPKFNEPDSYIAYITFLDENGNQLSREYKFRYVIKGSSAKILSIRGEHLESDDSIKVTLNVIGPADLTELEDCIVKYEISNANNNEIITQKDVTTTLDSNDKDISEIIGINNITGNLKIKASIWYDGKQLANDETNIEIANTRKDIKEEILFRDIFGTKYYEAVRMLAGMGILAGYPDGTFRAENSITRAEFTVIATRLAGLQPVSGEPSKFDDVSNEHWAKDYINLAFDNNIISGYGNGMFKPDNKVTYYETLTILMNVMGLREEVASNGLNWPENYVEKENELKLMKNVTVFYFGNEANRGNVALMAYETYLKIR